MTATKTKTVKEHFEEADQIAQHVKDADMLVRKLRDELTTARRALEWLEDFAPKGDFAKDIQFKSIGDFKNNEATAGQIIKTRVAAINALLGDRA